MDDDTDLKPFNHDKNRGKWASSKDFFFACAGYAFRADAIMIMPVMIFRDIGILGIFPYIIVMCVCLVPLVFLQSYLGQFSGTGFISVFRISPLFKGIGYVALFINVIVLTYYSLFSAVPLLFFFHSLKPNIPWSCEVVEGTNTTFMNTNFSFKQTTDLIHYTAPSVRFFENQLNLPNKYENDDKEHTFSPQLMVCCCIIWCVVLFVVSKTPKFIGTFLRYSFLTVVAVMSICLLRFLFLPQSIEALQNFWKPQNYMIYDLEPYISVPGLALSTMGPGWGSTLTMASFNNLKTDIYGYSWLLCLAQFGLMIGMSSMSIFIDYFMRDMNHHDRERTQLNDFLKIATGLTYLEMPHFWSLIFFGMWILGSLNILIVQLLSLLTSLFDEFEDLRENKRKITFGAVGVFAATSLIFCSNNGFYLLGLFTNYGIVLQIILHLLLLLVVLWIYGRERLLRDLKFMTSRIYKTWTVYMVRFVTPLIKLVALFTGLLVSMDLDNFPSVFEFRFYLFLFATIMFSLSIFIIPVYCIIKSKQNAGRKRKLTRPTDWYPADPVYKQRYEDTFSDAEASHQLISTAAVELVDCV